MKKGDAALIVLMVAACYFLSHVTADDIIAGFSSKPFTGTSCFGDDDKGNKVVRLSVSTWDSIEAKCGKWLRVICMGPETPGETEACNQSSSIYVDVKVVDRCEDCEEGTIKLSIEAFEEIAYKKAHRVKVTSVWAPW